MSYAEKTFKELVDEAVDRLNDCLDRCPNLHRKDGDPKRQYQLAIDALEEVQMRYTRGFAIQHGKFNPADLEKKDGQQ